MSRLIGIEKFADFARKNPGWMVSGTKFEKEFTFSSFEQAVTFVTHLQKLADDQNHHPDILIRFNRLLISLTTHDQGGLTQLDLSLAGDIEALFKKK